jgi:hypothetical protein
MWISKSVHPPKLNTIILGRKVGQPDPADGRRIHNRGFFSCLPGSDTIGSRAPRAADAVIGKNHGRPFLSAPPWTCAGLRSFSMGFLRVCAFIGPSMDLPCPTAYAPAASCYWAGLAAHCPEGHCKQLCLDSWLTVELSTGGCPAMADWFLFFRSVVIQPLLFGSSSVLSQTPFLTGGKFQPLLEFPFSLN